MKNTTISHSKILFYAFITSLLEFVLTVLAFSTFTWALYQLTGLHSEIPFWFILVVVSIGYFFLRGIISLFQSNVKFVEESVSKIKY